MLVFYKEQNSTRLNKIILERAKRNWNGLWPMERPQASGTRLGASGTPAGLSAVLVLFVGRTG